MSIIETLPIQHWQVTFSPELQNQAVNALESGCLLFLPQLNFELKPEEHRFLSPDFVNPKVKNISYDPKTDAMQRSAANDKDRQEIKALLKRFYIASSTLIHELFPSYQNQIRAARTSFRPVQVSNRKTSYRKDDRLLHVDAFPANPNQGQRILRVFSNINPHGEERIWEIGEPFVEVAKRFLPQISRPFTWKWISAEYTGHY